MADSFLPVPDASSCPMKAVPRPGKRRIVADAPEPPTSAEATVGVRSLGEGRAKDGRYGDGAPGRGVGLPYLPPGALAS